MTNIKWKIEEDYALEFIRTCLQQLLSMFEREFEQGVAAVEF